MKKSTKTLLAAFICTCALTFTGCGNNTSTVSTSSATSSADASTAVSTAIESAATSSSASNVSSVESAASVSNNESVTTSDALSPLWDNAQYKEDTEIGEGTNTIKLEVKIGGKSVTLTVKSDKDNLADILTDNKIVDGDNSEYGLYIKKVNGVLADYDTDKAFWGLYKDGEMTATGASSITIKDGEHYELVYTSDNATAETSTAEQPAA
ncbi:MAG: DUF4430 domain-containing protein [Oscillospiraceae bacterium]|nr:DUF4430 domain-containing protein [Oscillospiraceae bacterium]